MIRYYVILILAVVSLCSCGISRDYSSPNRVTLEFQDSGLKDCYLLSVEADVLLISDLDPAGLRSEVLASHTMILPSRDVRTIYQEHTQTFAGTYVPTITDIFSVRRPFTVNAFGSNLSALYDALRYSYEFFTRKPWSEYHMADARDVELLQSSIAPFANTGRHHSNSR